MSYGLICMQSNDFSVVKKFQLAVKEKTMQGWVPLGSHTHQIDEDGVHYLIQSLVKHWH